MFPEFSELPSSSSLPSAQREGATKMSGSPSTLDVDEKNAKRIRCISSESNSNINRRFNSECTTLNSIEVSITFSYNTMLIHQFLINFSENLHLMLDNRGEYIR